MKKRILSVLMILAMLLGALPISSFALSQNNTITEVFLEMDAYPAAGEGLCYPYMVSANSNPALADEAVSLTFTKWYSAEHYSLDGNTYGGYYDMEFQAGRAYNLNVELTPADGYVIAPNCEVIMVVDGDQFFGGYLYEWEGTVASFDFFFNLTGVEPILSDGMMELSALPQIGESGYDLMPDLVSLDNDEEYLLPLDYRASWRFYDEEDDTYYGEDEPFCEGVKYALFIEVFAKEEYTLSPDFDLRLTTPAGEKVGDLISSEGIKGKTFAFYFGELGDTQIIEEISLIAFLLPEAGMNPFRFSVATINGSQELKTNASVETWWGEYNSAEQAYLPQGNTPFVSGKKYAAELFVSSAEGYTFAPDCQITILNPTGEREFTLNYADESELDIAIYYPALILETNPFSDVKTADYYYDSVLWAVNNDITAGTAPGKFSPSMTCDRGQVVTFLWRAAGCPEPQSSTNPFKDVKKTDYYYKAVLWAVEEGITAGTAPGKFSPSMTCDRSQIVTFLYRFAGEPSVSGSNPFSDVKSTDYYYKAVLWAVEEGITAGTAPGKFSPAMKCDRSQVVTFLYRLMK